METLIYRIKNIDFLKSSAIIAVLFISLTMGLAKGYAADAIKVAVWPFQVYSKANAAFLQDAGGTNKTLVAGQPAEAPVLLRPGIEISIAGNTAVYQRN